MYNNYRYRNCGCNNMNKCNNYNAPVLVQENKIGCNSTSVLPIEYMNDNYDSCSCGFDEYDGMPEFPELAQSYVPIQQMGKVYDPCTGLKMGTMFPELVRPYAPCQDMEQDTLIRAMNSIKGGCNDAM